MDLKILIITGSLALALSVFAQEAKETGTVSIPHPGGFARWTIDYTYENDHIPGSKEPSFPPRLAREEYTATGGTAFLKKIYRKGQIEEVYQSGHFELTEIPQTQQIAIFDLRDEPTAKQLFRKIYPGFYWVKPELFSGEIEAFNQKCLYFHEDENEAWVSKETGLPVAFRIKGTNGRYSFLQPPPAPVELPPKYQQFIEDHFRSGPPPGQASSLIHQ